jgi:hypothetical protein
VLKLLTGLQCPGIRSAGYATNCITCNTVRLCDASNDAAVTTATAAPHGTSYLTTTTATAATTTTTTTATAATIITATDTGSGRM